jgi:hypothetical protein
MGHHPMNMGYERLQPADFKQKSEAGLRGLGEEATGRNMVDDGGGRRPDLLTFQHANPNPLKDMGGTDSAG